MPHEIEATGIAAIPGRVGARPGDRRCAIGHEGRKRMLWRLAVVRYQHQHATLRQRMADETVVLALAAGPAAAVEEHHDRRTRIRCRTDGTVDVQGEAVFGIELHRRAIARAKI